MILRAFLRCLKISFEAKEIKPIKSQFPDVQFRSHEFEIKEMLDQARRRHDEYKKHLNDLKRATKLSDLFETYTPVDITLDEIGKESPTRLKVFAVSIQSSKEEKLTFSFISTYTRRFSIQRSRLAAFFYRARIANQYRSWAAVGGMCLPHQFKLRNTLRKMLVVSVARRTYGIG